MTTLAGDRDMGKRGIFAAALLAAVFASAPVSAQQDGLYAATVVVTGRDNLPERARGFRQTLELVLVKVALDEEAALLAGEDGLLEHPERLVSDYTYRDRKQGIQISDEQGTRDRSFDLTVRFDPPAIDDLLLNGVSIVPWRGERPEIGAALTIDDGASRYLLTQVSQKGYGQRLAFADAARDLGLSVRLPQDEGDGLDTPARIDGLMTIAASGRWDSDWRLSGDGGDERLVLEGTTFDAAIRKALFGVVPVLVER